MQNLGSQLLLLAAGGSIGTILRFFVYQTADKFLNKHLPWGTLLVNLFWFAGYWAFCGVISTDQLFRQPFGCLFSLDF